MKKLLSRISVAAVIVFIIFLVSTFVLPSVPAQADIEPQYWAVIAGVSNYQSINDLSYCDDDAQDLYQALSPIWGTSHMRLLKDSQATKAAILSGIAWMADNADENDTVLFFFSGHGSDTGSGYFCPYDSLTYSWANDMSATELASALAPIRADQVIVILDCCYSGCFQDDLSNYGRVIMMACRSYELSYEYTALRNGAFTYFILEALGKFDEVDTNDDYILSAEEVAAYANTETYWYDYQQSPFMDDSYYGQLALIAKFVFALNTTLPYGVNILTLDGVNYTSLPAPMLWAPGVSHTISVPEFVDTGTGTRYIFTQWDDGSVSVTRIITSGFLTANYDKEHLLEVISDFGDIQGGGWYKDGTWADFSVTDFIELPDTRHIFTNWSGDYAGASAASSILMDAPATVVANWRHEYLLTLNSAYGTLTGAGWYREGETAAFSVTDYIELPDTKHIFTNWSGDYTGTSPSALLVINYPQTVNANWRNEYLLTLNSEYGEPTGAGWYREGETASISVEPVQGVIIRQIFTGWSGDLTDISPDSSLAINSPMVVTATWRTDYVQLYLLIGGVVVVGVITIVLVRRSRRAK